MFISSLLLRCLARHLFYQPQPVPRSDRAAVTVDVFEEGRTILNWQGDVSTRHDAVGRIIARNPFRSLVAAPLCAPRIDGREEICQCGFDI